MTEQPQPRTDAGRYSFKQQGAPTIELSGVMPLPDLPASVGTPEVGFYFEEGKAVTHVAVGGSTMKFWKDEDGEVTNSVESGTTTAGEDAPWGHIREYADFEQTRTWAEAVHARIETVTSGMDGNDIDQEYGPIIDFATGVADDQQSEADIAPAPESTAEKLADLTSGLAVKDTHLDAEELELDGQKRELGNRRNRLAGARAASAILTELPNAATLSYTRHPIEGAVELNEIRDATGKAIFRAEEVARPLYADLATTRRRGIIQRAVDGLKNQDHNLLPGVSSHGVKNSGYSEELNLAAAIDDGLQVLDADDLTPEQASAQRTDAALSHWVQSHDHLQEAVRDMFTDMRHHAKRNGIDLDDAFRKSQAVFLEETNDPTFKEGF